ncbi:MAG: hypothetical protein WCO09_02555 [bacterium]
MFTLTRLEHNPILSPIKEHPWEAHSSFNGCPIVKDGKTTIVYRAMSEPDHLLEPHISTSVIGIAESADGINFENRRVFFGPSEDFDKFGCEDPRITKIDETYYIFYTALGGYPYEANNIKVAVAISDDLKTVREKHIVTPFNAKAMAFFPEKINGKFAGLLTINTDTWPADICYVEFEKIEDLWSEEKWNEWRSGVEQHKINLRRKENEQVEMGTPPVKTDRGWLVAYSHIQGYATPDPVFGVETVLLDLENPRRIVGRTKGPFMVPETYYEKTGHVSNIIFPTGAVIADGRYKMYYGGADTHCAVASIYLENLLSHMTDSKLEHKFKRFAGNPIISPRDGLVWEAGGTINPAVININDESHIIYRAASSGNVSVLGYAFSRDGLKIDERPQDPIYSPRADFEKRHDGANDNYGCEDPRLVQIGDTIYMTYTGYDGVTPRIAVSSISVSDFLNRRWNNWVMPEVISPPNVPEKDSVIFPEKINGKYMIIHRVGTSICADFLNSLDFTKEKINKCIEILTPEAGMWDGVKIGLAGPPLKTVDGWLMLYHGISKNKTYRVGAVLLDLENPTVVKARTAAPIFEPEEPYEVNGLVPKVVFPCSLVVRGERAYIYYGAGDSVTGVATIKMQDLLDKLKV